jgi:hypothetical protein
MSWTQSVYSASGNVSSVGYDSDNGEMLVTWTKSGKTSAYSGVPEDVAQACANAPSVTSYVNSEIKGRYPHSYR